jgi:hypothetical protein
MMDSKPLVPPMINPEELIGRFLLDRQDDGQQFHAQIVKLVDDPTSQFRQGSDEDSSKFG